MADHSELEEEQAYLDHAYACLERSRADVERLRELVESGQGGTHQARYERDVIEEQVRQRLSRLELGDEVALVFGRIDRETGEDFHIGRLGVADERQEPVVVDWRAPVAEPFYRATGRSPMGLVRRRHFAVLGRKLLDIEDELLGAGLLGDDDDPDGRPRLRGEGALLATLERSRTGRLGDVVATIQAEQDEIIRSELGGVLVVQGGPGTGKTVVALHRAAYLLYTHRFPLEGQGVLVIGPNRLFLRYIERVLPSLGEAGVEQIVLDDLVPDVVVRAREAPPIGRVKGDARMAAVVAKAIRDRERPLREDLVVGWGLGSLRLRAEESARIVSSARRRYRRHNPARRFVEQSVFEALAASAREPVEWQQVRDRLRHTDELRAALERMWPVLTPAQLLHDLFGSTALLRLAAPAGGLAEEEWSRLHRPRSAELEEVRWTAADLALLDEARALLGPRSKQAEEEDEPRTYGHVVLDEAQDLSPMQLRMVARRSLNGSMTVVGDIAQATGALAPRSWEDLLAHLPDRRPARRAELTVGYRIPAPVMALASRVLEVVAPDLAAPVSVREGDPPRVVAAPSAEALGEVVAAEVRALEAAVERGNVAVVVPPSLAEPLSAALEAAGVDHGRAASRGTLDARVNLVPVDLVKGLELDAAVVVEPSRIVAEEAQGLRALYVALTRVTKRLSVVHAEPLPAALA